MTKTIQYGACGLVLIVGAFYLATTTHAYTLLGVAPTPEVTGIPSYAQAVSIGNEMATVTAEKTGRTFSAQVERNVSGGTYKVELREVDSSI